MISNLDSARSLIKADLEHARSVLELWTHQVIELEKTLEQMEAVGQSRVALRDEHAGVTTNGAPLLTAQKGAKRGRKPKSAAIEPTAQTASKQGRAARKNGGTEKAKAAAEEKPARSNASKVAKAGRSQKAGTAKKRTGAPQPKFKDPNSDKTWAGHGRRPLWMTGDPQQYAVQPDGGASGAATQSSDAAAQA